MGRPHRNLAGVRASVLIYGEFNRGGENKRIMMTALLTAFLFSSLVFVSGLAANPLANPRANLQSNNLVKRVNDASAQDNAEIVDIEAADKVHRKTQEAVAMLIDETELLETPSEIKLSRVEGRYCARHRFHGQTRVAGGLCTAFLVSPRVLMTSGHCMKEQECEVRVFAFGIQKSTTEVRAKDVYRCKKVHHRAFKPSRPGTPSPGDFSLIELDRPVVGRTPLRVSSQPLDYGDLVHTFGYADGLGLKVGTGFVSSLGTDTPDYIAQSSAFIVQGMSGGPAINIHGDVVGINTRGNAAVDTPKGCREWQTKRGIGFTITDSFKADLAKVLNTIEGPLTPTRRNPTLPGIR